jgi:hypothetical protein
MQGPLADGRKSGNQVYRTVGDPALTKSPGRREFTPFEPAARTSAGPPAESPATLRQVWAFDGDPAGRADDPHAVDLHAPAL